MLVWVSRPLLPRRFPFDHRRKLVRKPWRFLLIRPFHLLHLFFSVLTDMDAGEIASMRTLGITESYKLKQQVVVSASEAAEMILR